MRPLREGFTMATKSRKTAVAKKSSRRSSTAKKAAAKKAPARKTAAKKAAAKKAPARKPAAKKAPAKKAAPKKLATRKTSSRKTPARKTSARAPSRAKKAARPVTGSPDIVQVETTSAGLQPLAPVHAPVDDLSSSGNEVLDIFQRYDRDRTGTIDRAEFARLLEALGQNISDEELEIAIDIVDTDRTGKISWNEFKDWWNSR